VAGRVDEVTSFGAIVPFSARTGYALNVCLIEDNTSFCKQPVLGVINCDFVGLQPVSANPDIDVTLIHNNARVLWSGYCLLGCIHFDLIGGYTLNAIWSRCWSLHR